MPRKEPGEPYTRVTAEEARMMLESDPDAVVIDVRNQDEYRAGHVRGAVLIPVDDVLSRFDEIPQGKTLLFICQMGQRSGLACEMAAAMGVAPERLFNIEDGTPGWMERSYPTGYGMEP